MGVPYPYTLKLKVAVKWFLVLGNKKTVGSLLEVKLYAFSPSVL
jgi:hypothetical protein